MNTLICRRGRPSNRRAMIQTVAAVLLIPAFQCAHAQLAISTAINRTARFRALSQRIAKAYCQVHLNVLPTHAREVLSMARQLVRGGFDDLAKAQWPADLSRQLAEVRKLADALDALLVMPPTKDSVAAVSAQADRMMAAANTATEAFEKLSKTGTARLVNTAGRQRMLSQRLAKNYFLSAAGLDGKSVRDQMAADALEFKQAMANLANAPISTVDIRNELALGDSQWVFFNAALQRKPDARGLEAVATTSERILEVTDRLTGLYEAALKDVLE